MAENFRTEFQIERDRREIADLYARKGRTLSHQRIAEILNERRQKEWFEAAARDSDAPVPYELSRQMITYDIAAIRREWRKYITAKIDDYIAEQLRKIDEAEAAAWEGWERSIRVAKSTVTKKLAVDRRGIFYMNDTGEKQAIIAEQITKNEEQAGEPQFLLVILKCVEKRAELLGLNKPTEIKHSGAVSLAELVKDAAGDAKKTDADAAAEDTAE